MDYRDKQFDTYGKQEEQSAPAWEKHDITQLIKALKQRNAAARRPREKQKSRSRKKVDEVLLRIFED